MAFSTQYLNLASGETLSFAISRGDSYVESTPNAINIAEQIHSNMVSSNFRIFVLFADEFINYEIPPEDIKLDGSYNENYQNGQRRTLSFTLYNHLGQYNPDINTLSVGTRLRLEMGAELYNGDTLWISKGIFVITNISTNETPQGKEVAVSCGDKFSMFEGNMGKLSSVYTIPTGTVIEDIIKTIITADMGNGIIYDSKDIIYHSSLIGKKTQCTISKNTGDSFNSLLLELATQLSAEMFYNSNGNLVITPIDEVTNDQNKPLLYVFNSEEGEIGSLNFSVDYSKIINKIIVIGTSSSGGVYQAIAANKDASSPYCCQRIGDHIGNIIQDSSISSQVLAQERADYELRMQMILKTSTSASVLFNPLLEVNNLIAITDPFFDLVRERFVLQSISCPLDYSNQMNITFSNINNLPFTVK